MTHNVQYLFEQRASWHQTTIHQAWTQQQQNISPPCYDSSLDERFFKRALCTEHVSVWYCKGGIYIWQELHTLRSSYPWRTIPTSPENHGKVEEVLKKRRQLRKVWFKWGAAWEGFSKHSGMRITVRSSIWRPSALAWLMKKVGYRTRVDVSIVLHFSECY